MFSSSIIAFRDGSGQVGITHAHCLHRGAPLFFGKVEERGIRCSYHGSQARPPMGQAALGMTENMGAIHCVTRQ
ncbi:Rieske 2Fe-2S domain-containing protein [Bordetella bronchiseptica]|uniref:Rieske 2Fe-2S domain-containing protein n=1 Tax=Bordetella bronchiseptica TaxID=518 RepID=UPI003D323005